MRVIKRYQNRKLYDTKDSKYVNLKDIGEMIGNNEAILVVDNKTKKDVTSRTLTQYIFELEKNSSALDLDLLTDIIQKGSGSITNYINKVFSV